MTPCWKICFFLLMKYSLTDCLEHQCNYTVKRRDNSSVVCLAHQCDQFLDLISIMVQPKTCKTSLLRLAFSSYKNFVQFRDQLRWKIADLFPSQSIKEDRQLILFLDQLDNNDKPFDHNELVRLGKNIDFYTLYIRNIEEEEEHFLFGSIHYDPLYPGWNVIKLKLRCRKLSAFDQYPCSNEIISPSFVAPQRSPSVFHPTTTINDHVSNDFLSFKSSSTDRSITTSKETDQKSLRLILIFVIPIFIILITMLFSIFVYLCVTGRYPCQRSINASTGSLSVLTTSDKPSSTEKISASYDNTIVPENELNSNQVPNPVVYRECHPHTNTQFTSHLNDHYEKVLADNISINRQQYFVRMSSSN